MEHDYRHFSSSKSALNAAQTSGVIESRFTFD